jgi:hypothetical protein
MCVEQLIELFKLLILLYVYLKCLVDGFNATLLPATATTTALLRLALSPATTLLCLTLSPAPLLN